MSNLESLQYAQSRLGLARMVGDTAEVTKWQEHVAYWQAAQQSVHPTVCYACADQGIIRCDGIAVNCPVCNPATSG